MVNSKWSSKVSIDITNQKVQIEEKSKVNEFFNLYSLGQKM